MKIGILGVGHIGKTLARTLPAAGHDVKVANSRGPETIDPDVLANGARAVSAAEAVTDVDVVILSIPLNRLSGWHHDRRLALRGGRHRHVGLLYPFRDARIEAIEAGQVESLWVVEQLGRPVRERRGTQSGPLPSRPTATQRSRGRIAIPLLRTVTAHREVAMALVEGTGFDAFDAGRWPNPGASSPVPPLIALT